MAATGGERRFERRVGKEKGRVGRRMDIISAIAAAAVVVNADHFALEVPIAGFMVAILFFCRTRSVMPLEPDAGA